MATTGERLVDISTLATGTALQHFLNISTGGGGETIYVERLISGDVSSNEVTGAVSHQQVTGSVSTVAEITGQVVISEVQGELGDDSIIGTV
jgi:hypothetical protein